MRLYVDPAEPESHVALLGDLPDHTEVVRRQTRRGAEPSWPEGLRPAPGALPRWEDGRSGLPEPSGDDRDAVARVAGLLAAIRRAGGALDQDAYEHAAREVFERLDDLEDDLATRRWLEGGTEPTLADAWLYAVLVRFDIAYAVFFKLEWVPVADRPHLGGFLRDYHQRPGVASTVDRRAVQEAFAWRDDMTNPGRLVPRGGRPDLRSPHERWRLDLRVAGGGVEEDPSRPRRPGEWVRPRSGHRDWISADGSTGLPAEAGRYHLYVAKNCPWSHRAMLGRALKGLQDVVSMDVLFYRRHPSRGWQFRPDVEGCTADTVNGTHFLRDVYALVGSDEKSVPVLWDKQTGRVVNNESAEILRMLNGAFDDLSDVDLDLYPEPLRPAIDHLNAWVYTEVNNGAYKAGFSDGQAAYDHWADRVFAALRWLDRRLRGRRFLLGGRLTEADVRLFPTIFRFDPVYRLRFRLLERRVADFDHLSAWLERMASLPEVQEASDIEHCKRGYFGRTGDALVPLGPA